MGAPAGEAGLLWLLWTLVFLRLEGRPDSMTRRVRQGGPAKLMGDAPDLVGLVNDQTTALAGRQVGGRSFLSWAWL